MKLRVKHNDTLYTYEENIWLGTKSLYVNGVKCSKLDKKSFVHPETKELIIIKGTMLSNITLSSKSTGLIYLAKNKPLDWVLIYSSFLVILVAIMLKVGGLWCGLAGAGAVLAAYLNSSFIRSDMNKALKTLLCFSVSLGTIALWYGVVAILVSLIF